jgi:Flp pilus assembly protein TadG
MLIFGMGIFALVGMVALSIDGGYILAERRQAQNAADAGALAAAKSLLDRNANSVIVSTGKSYAEQNAGTGSVATVEAPPTSGKYANNTKYVRVTVTKPVREFFVGAVYTGPWQVTAEAVAGIEPVKKAYALLALNCPGITINGTVQVTITNGSAMSNCDILASGGSNRFHADGSIDAKGVINGNSGWSAGEGIHGGQPNVPDPLAGTPAPPQGTPVTAAMLTAGGFTGAGSNWSCANGATCTLPAGYYKNMKIDVGGTALLSNGVYYFDGNSNLSEGNTNSWVKGTNVLHYFAGHSTFTPGNGNVSLKPSANSPYAGGLDGMVMWIAKPNCSAFDSGGNGTFAVEGVIYAPCSLVDLHGTPTSNGVQVIAGTLNISGTSSLTLVYREYIKIDVPHVFLVE